MSFTHNTILMEKFSEAIKSVLPVVVILFLLCFTILPVPNSILMAFIFGTVLLIIGMGLFTLGADLAMTPIGEHIGSAVSRSRNLWLIIIVSFLVGTIVTISEPDLHVLAQQAPDIPNNTLILAVSIGVGIFLVIAMLRIFFRISINTLFIIFYLAIFVIACFTPANFIPVAFDSGGVSTGPMTVPFIMAMGIGVARSRSDSSADEDSFGLLGLCSVGPILATMILGLLYPTQGGAYTPVTVPNIENSKELWLLFVNAFPIYLEEVGVAMLPIILFFLLFQIFVLHLTKIELVRISFGLLYTFIGLSVFFTGANVGFIPLGNYAGQLLGALETRWIVIPIGALIGYFLVVAEPAVQVLNKQVEEITEGSIPQRAMGISLSAGVALSVALAMIRVLTGINIMYFLIPFYAIALILTFFVPPIFTSIAFDSGGVAAGTMTSTFLLPLAMGLCSAVGGNVVQDAFGIIAMVAMTPLTTIQILGLVYKIRAEKTLQKPEEIAPESVQEERIITFSEES